MKKQNKNKKLSLNPETLFRLTDETLVHANGGGGLPRSATCEDSQ